MFLEEAALAKEYQMKKNSEAQRRSSKFCKAEQAAEISGGGILPMRHLSEIEPEGYGRLAVGQILATKGKFMHWVREAAEAHVVQPYFTKNDAYTVVVTVSGSNLKNFMAV